MILLFLMEVLSVDDLFESFDDEDVHGPLLLRDYTPRLSDNDYQNLDD